MDQARAAVRSIAADGRATADVGRTARLELTFQPRRGRTALAHAYAEPPFRVGRVLPDGDGVHLILASSAPGIFGGDRLAQTIVVESGARVRLTSQSAIQVHPNEIGARATLNSTYRVERDGCLDSEWDPLIPFRGADFEQRIQIELDDGATLLWHDAFMAGREAHGERWQFARLAHELSLIRSGVLAYLERYTIVPANDAPIGAWTANDACYFATVLASAGTVTRDFVRALHYRLQEQTEVRASVDLIEHQLMLIRLAARDGVSFRQARTLVASARPALT